MGNASVDPGHDGRFDHLPHVNPARYSQIVERWQQQMGVTPGARLALLVRPSLDFISLVFALFKSCAVSILIDPGYRDAVSFGLLLVILLARPRGLYGRRFFAEIRP